MGDRSRPRRRVEKRSAAADYDRSMDAPGTMGSPSLNSADAVRSVDLEVDGEAENDDEADHGKKSKDSYLTEKPPHY
ncbi:hypothetical protein [Corynebacterium lubricantis]|uniref:hypothetical protein n=1 Tax=Corynebacterium lubricantis TaxID=541095 RepID=UPI0003707BE3|nr:hypothetical protein [Corynebacterium lubricantis]